MAVTVDDLIRDGVVIGPKPAVSHITILWEEENRCYEEARVLREQAEEIIQQAETKEQRARDAHRTRENVEIQVREGRWERTPKVVQ